MRNREICSSVQDALRKAIKSTSNKMRRIPFLALILIPIISFGQSASIRGKLDIDAFPILLLKSISDSTFVRSTLPNEDNIFIFKLISPGDYYLESSENGINPQRLISHIMIKDTMEVDLGLIHYEPRIHELKEVVITAQKPIYQSKVGKYIFNVENSSFTQGKNSLEILQRTPLVLVDPNENISLQGKNPTIYINGRKSELQTDQLISYLKSIPSDQISRIEVITVPPAKYDAAGSGGVIDIIMKKSTRLGVSGNANMAYQICKRYGIFPSVSLNFDTSIARFFLSSSFNQSNNKNKLDSKTTYFEDTHNQIWNSNAINESPFSNNYSSYLSGGVELFFNANNTLYFESNYQHSKRKMKNTDRTTVYKENNILIDSLINSESIGENRSNVFNSNLYHTLTLKRIKGTLESGVGYFDYDSHNSTAYSSEVLSENNDALSTINYILETPPSAWGWNIKSDLHGIWEKRLEYGAGVKYSHTNTKFEQNMQIQKGNRYYDSFLYKEDILSGYLDLQYLLLEKWTLKGGLRLENTNWKGKSTTLNTWNEKSYLDIFPSLFIRYNPGENHAIELAYNRRIDRPEFSKLNPAKRYNNPYSYVTGNPDLAPQIYNNYQVNYIFKSKYALYLNYAQSDNGIYFIREMDNINNISYHIPVNLTTDEHISAALSLPVTLIKDWWNMNIYLSQQFDKSKRPDYGYNSNHWQPATIMNLRSSTPLSRNKKTSAEVSFFYISEHNYGIQKVSEVSNLSFTFIQKILKDKGIIQFSIDNVLNWGNSSKNWMSSNSPTGSYYQYGTDSNYGLKFSFSYRFESGLKRNADNKSSLINEQQKRSQY